MNRLTEELLEFKVDAIDVLGNTKGRQTFAKVVRSVRRMPEEEALAHLKALRISLNIPKKTDIIVRPCPTRKIKLQRRVRRVNLSDVNDAIGVHGVENPYTIEDPEPTKDILIGDLYPYTPPENPVKDVPVQLDSIDDIYPYTPAENPVSDIPAQLDNLGTLMPPRPIYRPWRTASTKLFHPGDYVISKIDHAVGIIQAIRGEEALVHFGNQRYLRMPIQDLAIYYGTSKQLKKVERKDTTDLARIVGRNPSR
jgi:hypothetical protein